MEVKVSLFDELEKNKCVKGCGGCCYLVMPSKEELEEVEKNLEKLPPQYLGKKFFPYSANLKIITIEHDDGTLTYEPTCPFLYVADNAHKALENFEIDYFEKDMLIWNKGKLTRGQRKIPHIRIKGPNDFAFLCGIHEEIRTKPAIQKIFSKCEKWKYLGIGSDSYHICNRGVLAYSERIETAQRK